MIVFQSNGHRLVGEPAELVKTRGGALTNLKGLVRSGAKPEVNFRGRKVTLSGEHVLQMLIARVRHDVERYAKEHELAVVPNTVAVCVPPASTEAELKAVSTAVREAGFEISRLVYDVSCAALVFSHRAASALAAAKEKEKQPSKKKSAPTQPQQQQQQEGSDEAGGVVDQAQNVLFLDVGHDFASAQIAFVDPANASLKILATESRVGIGASAFEGVLVELWKQELVSRHKVDVGALTGAARDRAHARLSNQAEKVKVMLSGLPEVSTVVDSVVPELDLKTKVTRTAMEQGALEVVTGLKQLLENVVKSAGLASAADVKRVEVVGGGSRIPCVQQVVRDLFGAALLHKTLDNECCQSYGAALFAGIAQGSVAHTVTGQAGPETPAAAVEDAALESVRALEREMHEDDLAVRARNDAKNVLETFIFDTRRHAGDVKPGTETTDSEEALDSLRSILSRSEDWLAEEAEESDATTVLAKLEQVRTEAAAAAPKLFEELKRREEKARLEKLEAQQSMPGAGAGANGEKKKRVLRPQEKLAEAKSKKDHGNSLFKDGNVEDAVRRYTQSLGLCGEMDGTLNPTDQAECNEVKLSCYLNLTLCNIKLKAPKLALHNATKAVELKGDSAKAHFRKAQALYECKEFEEAKKELLAAQKLDPEDKGIPSLLTKVDQCIQAEKKKQQQIFGKMFK